MGENEPMSVDGVELKSASPPPDPSDTSHTDAVICDTVDTESVLGGNGVELKNPPQSESEPALFDNNVDFNVQAVANNGVEDFNISSQEPQVQPMLNDVKDSNFESSGGNTELKSGSEQPREGSSPPTLSDDSKSLLNPGTELSTDGKTDANNSTTDAETAGVTADAKPGSSEVLENKSDNTGAVLDEVNPQVESPSIKTAVENTKELKTGENNENIETPKINGNSSPKLTFLLEEGDDGSESGTEEEQSAFVKELEKFFRGKGMDFKPPKFYGEVLNCLKLWRSVMRLGGYDKVTSSKLWRIIGESFKPPKTCTTVSWTFRGFYEKTLLEYERQKTRGGEIVLPDTSHSEPIGVENQTPGSGRARRDAAARAMQCWHSRLHGNGEASDTTLKDKNSLALQKQEKSVASLKRRKPTHMEDAVKAARAKTSKAQLDVDVVDLGSPADWVKINVQRNKDCFEVYALVPGLLREEVRVQSDPAGRLVISGEPEQPDNPWGVTPFRKVVTLPGRIDPHHTSAVVTLHGQLFVRVPFEQSG